MTTEKFKNIIAPTTVGAIFVSLSTVVKADRLLTLYKSNPFSYEKAGFLFKFSNLGSRTIT